MAAFAVLVLGALFALLALADFDGGLMTGAGIGLGAAVLLMLFNGFTTRLALREGRRSAAQGHVLGGFLLRIVILTAGFFGLAFSGAASPVTFALAFLAGVLLMLGWQVFTVSREIQKRAQMA